MFHVQHDHRVAEEAGADLLFTPDADEIYPEGIKNATTAAQRLKLPDVATRPGLEDAIRPNFFSGVCLVVSRLLELTNPRHCLFGEKDYQQLLVPPCDYLYINPIVHVSTTAQTRASNTTHATATHVAHAILPRTSAGMHVTWQHTYNYTERQINQSENDRTRTP